MKKSSVVSVVMLVTLLVVGLMVLAPGNALAKKQNVKFVIVGAPEGAQEAAWKPCR
jgi:Ca2+/H+ antiporter